MIVSVSSSALIRFLMALTLVLAFIGISAAATAAAPAERSAAVTAVDQDDDDDGGNGTGGNGTSGVVQLPATGVGTSGASGGVLALVLGAVGLVAMGGWRMSRRLSERGGVSR